MKNAKIRTDEKMDYFEGLDKPVREDELRIIVMGGVGRGKTYALIAIQKALCEVMPDTDVVLVNSDMVQSDLVELATNSHAKTLINISENFVKVVNLYQLATNKSGKIRGRIKTS